MKIIRAGIEFRGCKFSLCYGDYFGWQACALCDLQYSACHAVCVSFAKLCLVDPLYCYLKEE